MLEAVYGWRKLMPLAGRDVISVFSDPRDSPSASNGLIRLGSIVKLGEIDNIEDLCRRIRLFMGDTSVQAPIVAYSEVDPLDIVEDVEFVMEELSSYNDLDMMHSTYIETFGNEPDKFSRLLRLAPEYIGIKFVVPKSSSDGQSVGKALDCLNRAIYASEVRDSERYLIIILDDGSDINLLKKYFEIIRDGLGSDDRFDFAQGAALSSFDVIIRPNCSDLGKVLDAHRILLHPELDLSQQVIIDTSVIK